MMLSLGRAVDNLSVEVIHMGALEGEGIPFFQVTWKTGLDKSFELTPCLAHIFPGRRALQILTAPFGDHPCEIRESPLPPG